MADPIALDILEAIETRLQAITVVGGYNTDAGNQVYLGKRQVNPDEVDTGPVILVFDESDELAEEGGNVCGTEFVQMSVSVQAFMEYVAIAHTRLMHLLIQDIKRSIFLSDSTMGGICSAVLYGGREVDYPEPGGETVAVTVTVNILYFESYGAP